MRLRMPLCANAPLNDVRVLTLPNPGTIEQVKRTFTEFSEDNMTDWAAALTYYGLLSLFPALIALALLLGMELNAERERAKELEAGDTRAEKEIQLEPRSEPKDEKTT
jgi:uncharacterized BrkB/YihY/UPF0761 family membrane protein